MKCLKAVFLIIFICNAFPCHAQSIKELEKKYGIQISTNHEEAFEKMQIYSLHLTAVSSHQRKIMISLLSESLKCYKPSILKRNLKKIYLVNNIYAGKYEIAGTYSAEKKIIVLAAWKRLGYFFHHEFSSLLLLQDSGFKERWIKYNKLPYLHESDFSNMKSSHSLRKAGFYYDYSQVSFEEDFNVLAGMLLVNPRGTEQKSARYSRILKKIAIIKRFYKNIFICSL